MHVPASGDLCGVAHCAVDHALALLRVIVRMLLPVRVRCRTDSNGRSPQADPCTRWISFFRQQMTGAGPRIPITSEGRFFLRGARPPGSAKLVGASAEDHAGMAPRPGFDPGICGLTDRRSDGAQIQHGRGFHGDQARSFFAASDQIRSGNGPTTPAQWTDCASARPIPDRALRKPDVQRWVEPQTLACRGLSARTICATDRCQKRAQLCLPAA